MSADNMSQWHNPTKNNTGPSCPVERKDVEKNAIYELDLGCVGKIDKLVLRKQSLFVQKYSVCPDEFPLIYPGEEFFFLSKMLHLTRNDIWALNVSGIITNNPLEQFFFSSSFSQQVSLMKTGFLSHVYHSAPCPKPILHWLFQLMSSNLNTSRDSFKTLWEISISTLITSEHAGQNMWSPSLKDIDSVLQNLGASLFAMYPLEKLDTKSRCTFMRYALLHQKKYSRNSMYSHLLVTNLNNIMKFLTLCALECPHGLSDQELLILITLLCRISLDVNLKHEPKEDLRQLLLILLEKITDWLVQMPKLCISLSQISSHHHNLLSVVQMIPDTTNKAQQMKKQLSLLIIAKLMSKDTGPLLWVENLQLPFICELLKDMKPSSLKLYLEQRLEAADPEKEITQRELDWEACYLCHTLLKLANIVVAAKKISLNKWIYLQKLCIQLNRHIINNIRENPVIMYRSKLKDLATYNYIKWKDMLFEDPRKMQYSWVQFTDYQDPGNEGVGVGGTPKESLETPKE
ncbi:protein FAM178B [Pelobates fuscus]|uniref:protein FAM178B n=1 Tax=Pelobates fuscus TaxID=191477 RepID=UPI002FE4C9A4